MFGIWCPIKPPLVEIYDQGVLIHVGYLLMPYVWGKNIPYDYLQKIGVFLVVAAWLNPNPFKL